MTVNIDTSNPQTTTLEAIALTITPPMRLVKYINVHRVSRTTEQNNDINVHLVSKTTEQVKHRNVLLVSKITEQVKHRNIYMVSRNPEQVKYRNYIWCLEPLNKLYTEMYIIFIFDVYYN